MLAEPCVYDSLNRLAQATETGGTNEWSQTYSYDRFGNRAVAGTIFDAALTPPSLGAFDPATNRIKPAVMTGFSYDTAGSLASDPHTPASGIIYDAENRQTGYTKTGVGTTSYGYNGDGHRVKKIDPSNNTTIFVYNVGGQLIAEYTSGAPSPNGTSYLTSDHLGSTRVVTKQDGTVKVRYDYLPFGEEIGSDLGSRTLVTGYGVTEGTRQKFTQKERDIESGLDYFGARYYSSAQGRFTSPDEFDPVLGLQGAADRREGEKQFRRYLNQPQHWNRYPYALNNPLRYVDPDGFGETLTERLNIVWDEASNYTEEERNRIRQAYVERAKKAFGKIDVAFDVTETTGSAKDKDQQSREITSGKSNDAVNVFFTKSEVGPSSEVTQPGKSQIFISTTKGALEGNLIHGLIHALGVASDVNGYTRATAERDTVYAGSVLEWLPFLASYDDDRKPKKVTLRQGGLVSSFEFPYPPTAFDVIRDGARRYLKK